MAVQSTKLNKEITNEKTSQMDRNSRSQHRGAGYRRRCDGVQHERQGEKTCCWANRLKCSSTWEASFPGRGPGDDQYLADALGISVAETGLPNRKPAMPPSASR
jgi:hypothetical protein